MARTMFIKPNYNTCSNDGDTTVGYQVYGTESQIIRASPTHVIKLAYRTCSSATAISDAATVTNWYPEYVSNTYGENWLSPVLHYDEKPIDLSKKLRQIIETRQAPMMFVRRRERKVPLPETDDLREIRARLTLKRLIGDQQYTQLLRWGYVSIQGKSGKWYKLKPGNSMATVYENGLKVNSLCIQLSGKFPPTDSLVMRCMMVWNTEEDLWKIANKHGANNHDSIVNQSDERSLSLILSDLRLLFPNVPLIAPTKAA